MFLDESTHKLDGKGRVFCPKRFQEVLESDGGGDGNLRCVLAMGFEGCLFLFTVSGFQDAAKRLITEAFAGAEQRDAQRWFFSNSCRVTLDSTGRILIPEKMRTHAGITGEVAMAGAFERAEIWDAERWAEVRRRGETHFQVVDKVLNGDRSISNEDRSTSNEDRSISSEDRPIGGGGNEG